MSACGDKEPLLTKYSSTYYGSARGEHKNERVEQKYSFVRLFRYASKGDLILVAIGSMFAIMHGASMPVLALVFGQMTNTFILQSASSSSNGSQPLLTPSQFTSYMTDYALYYMFIGMAVFGAGLVQTVCWEYSCERQVYQLRKIFYSQLLRQDSNWYDVQQDGDLTTKLSDDLERIREGIGCKLSMVLQYTSAFLSGLAVGLYSNLKLTLLIIGVSPILIATSAYMAKIASSSAAREQLKYSLAGKIADEVLTSIRTVAAYGAEVTESKRYEVALEEGRRLAMKKYYVLAVGISAVFFVLYGTYGLAFWYGAELIRLEEATPGSVFTVFFSVMAGAFSLGNALPFVNAVSAAVGAASTLYAIIDRVPSIDPYSSRGLKPEKVEGSICLEGVVFQYPARPQVRVLKGLTLDITAGTKIALVGPSGSGKSTIISLIMRLYEPIEGRVLLDNHDLRDVNLPWLRSQIGLVSQEPVLFGVSIAENIRYGQSEVTQGEIKAAAKIANAHNFICALPKGYETLVGERGTQLSGGQKQRIAIARALVKDPKILLLDEATSALDTQSEGQVQVALERAMYRRTTIIVAHRLSTIRNADLIYVMKDGTICERGTHQELMGLQRQYYSLVNSSSQCEPGEYTDLNLSDKSQVDVEVNSSYTPTTPLESSSTKDVADETLKTSMWKLLALNKPEWRSLTLGLIGCVFSGSIMPVFAYFYGEMFATFQLRGDDLKDAALFWTYMFVVLAVASSGSYWLQMVAMVTAAEKLVMRLRLLAFENIICQAIGWFDEEKHSSGRLITRLARDAPLVKAAAGLRAGHFVTSGVTLMAALVIAFVNGWKLALVLLLGAPLIVGASYQQMMILRRNQQRDAHLMDEAGRIATESVQNVKTVQALGLERLFVDQYQAHLVLPYREAKKQAWVYALVFAFSQCVIFMMYAGAFRFGAYLIETDDMTPTQVFRVFFALAFCAASVGQSSAYLQDYAKAKLAASLMLQLIHVRSDIDCRSVHGIKPVIQGRICFKDVHFRYPARPDVTVLKGVSLEVEPGQTVALVGESGGGKSTFVALLQRFYDPEHGTVCVDNFDIRSLNLEHWRRCMGLVTQEPVLFDCTIRENIGYGVEELDMADIVAAATCANIHEFISGLPQGYETKVGERGTQLSGGQKQRIAIARALVRNPKILLLDEATSALDSESEKVVQEALERAREGRTCIIIAHRLSTIKSADRIAVLSNGIIVEQGTHEQLKQRRGRYYELIKRQHRR